MSIIDVLSAPGAIVPDKLLEIQQIYGAQLRGEAPDIAAIEARLGRPLANEQRKYEVREGGIAVLPVAGVIAAKANLLTEISGGTSASMLEQQVQSLRADPAVRGVVLDIDSPGGSTQGTPALAAAVRQLAAEKPTIAVSTGTMASAAYWIGSAANSIHMSGPTDVLGSIGVVATHSYSPQARGQTTEITAGRYKRMVSASKPLDAEGRAYIQAQVDEIYAVFVETVAANRGVSVDDVLVHMADGRIWIGRQALEQGLADGIATVDEIAARMAADPQFGASRSRARIPGAPPQSQAKRTAAMTPQEQMAAFVAENPAAAELLRVEGAARERARIDAVRAQAMPGHEALIERLAADGVTDGAAAAMAVVAAERAARTAQAAARSADAPAPIPQADAPVDAPKPKLGSHGRIDGDVDQQALLSAAQAYIAKHPGTTIPQAVKAVQQGA